MESCNDATLSCSEALKLIDALLDGELDDTQAIAVEAHLKACHRCEAHLDVEKLVKESVKRCCEKPQASEDLRNRVMNSLSTTRVEWVTGVVVTRTIRVEFRDQ